MYYKKIYKITVITKYMNNSEDTMRMKNGPDGTLYVKIKSILKSKYNTYSDRINQL